MAWTKRQLLEQAFAEIGRAAFTFDLQPEELQSGLRSLDMMMATWASKGVNIAWIGGNGLGDIDADANVPEWALEAIALNLAVRLAPSYGKAVSLDTKASAKAAFDAVLARCVVPRDRQVTGYAGAGNGNWTRLVEDEQPITTAAGAVTIDF